MLMKRLIISGILEDEETPCLVTRIYSNITIITNYHIPYIEKLQAFDLISLEAVGVRCDLSTCLEYQLRNLEFDRYMDYL